MYFNRQVAPVTRVVSPSRRWVFVLTMAICLLRVGDGWGDDAILSFTIPPSSADEGLNLFAQQADLQLIYPYDAISAIRIQGLSGRFTVEKGIKRLLRGTCLQAVINHHNKLDSSQAKKYQGVAIVNNHKCKKTSFIAAFNAAILGTLFGMPAHSQDDNARAVTRTIEEVIVTARKTQESAQSVPVSLTAKSGDQLNEYGVATFTDIRSIAPNLNIQQWPFDSQTLTVAMRGQKQDQVQLTLDQSVGIYVDGFYYARPMGLGGAMIDVERVEVLRGPQGTLYGKNTTGGAVSIYTADPGDQLGGSLDMKMGSYDANDYTGIVNIPIAEEVGLRLVAHRSLRDGYATDPQGRDVDDENLQYYRAKLKAALGDSVDMTLSGAYTRSKTGGSRVHLAGISGAGAVVNQAAAELAGVARWRPGVDPAVDALVIGQVPNALAALQSWADADYSEVGNNTRTFSAFEGAQVALTFDVALSDNLTLKSITGYHEFKREALSDYDGTPFQILSPNPYHEDEVLSQELQLSGSSETFEWVTGLFASSEEGYGQNTGSPTLPALTGGPFNLSAHDIKNHSYAAYAQTNWTLNDSWRLTTGVRYSIEGREMSADNRTAGACLIPAPGANDIAGGTLCPRTFDETYRAPSWLASLDHTFSDEVMGYLKVARGFRSGGQNQTGERTSESFVDFDAEIVTEYEVGLKSDLLGNTLRFNVAAYYADYEDIQRAVTVPTLAGGIAVRIDNAASATIQGFETELTWFVSDSLTLNGWAGFTDASYDEYLSLGVDRSAEKFPIPDWTSSIDARYLVPVTVGDVRLTLGYYWQSETDFSRGAPMPDLVTQDSYGLVRAKLSWLIPEHDLEVSLFGRNLADEEYFVEATSAIGSLGLANLIPGEPRVWGLEFKKGWGDY